MKSCDECKVSFSGDLRRCPLCGKVLKGTATPSEFPAREVHHTSKRARRLLGVATLACIAATIIGGITLHASALGIVVICAALALTYIFLHNVIVHSPDFLRIIERYFLLLIGVAALAFIGTGNTIISTYAIPLISTAAIVFNTVLVAMYRSIFVSGYAKYLLYNLVLGLVPLVFVFTGLVSLPIPAYIDAAASVLLAAVLAILARKQSAEEARKLFSA